MVNASTVRAAAVQAAPSYTSAEDTASKTCALIIEAASRGVQVLAFPEVWLGSGYPLWIWGRYGFAVQDAGSKQEELKTRYIRNSIDFSSDVGKSIIARISTCARENGVAVVLGLSERDGDKLYMGQALIDAQGAVRVTRRKMRPFGLEKLLFGNGQGKDLENVVAVDLGTTKARVGMLSCGEHYNPLINYHTFAQDEEIHVAAWPPVAAHPGGMDIPYSMSDDAVAAVSRTYAKQAQAFVLHSTGMITDPSTPVENGTDLPHAPVFNTPGGGNARIYAPDGRLLTKDLPARQEGMVVADLDIEWCARERKALDCRTGDDSAAMARGDVLKLIRIGRD